MDTDILPFWQEIGTSTSIIAKRVSEKLKTPTSHTGTLDPMASGVVLILIGEEYFNKEKFIQTNKTYEFSLILGFDTDTHDALGMPKNISFSPSIADLDLVKNIKDFEGFYHQRYPDFSSKKIAGKSLWEYKRLGLDVPEVFIDGEISEIKILGINMINSELLISEIKEQVEKIKGNFRQEEILSQYTSTKFPLAFQKIDLSVKMSRGLYVRGLVRDICEKINLPGIVFNLVRIKDGEYTKDNCIRLTDFFSEEIKSNPNYLEPEYKKFKNL